MDSASASDRLLAWMVRHRIRGVRTTMKFLGVTEVTARTRYGSIFAFRPADYIDRLTLLEGYYESEVLDAISKDLPQNAVVWDVGTNFGLHAITLKVLRPDIEVICFEPSPGMASRISKHAAMNKTSVAVHKLALSDRTGLMRLHEMTSGNTGMSTLIPWREANYSRTIDVNVQRGDNLIASRATPPPHTIKIDVEGSEYAVLEGLSNLIANSRPRLIMEGDESLSDHVRSMGYTIRPLVRNENTHHGFMNFEAR